MTDSFEKVDKVTYVPLQEQSLTWWEWLFGKNEPIIEADPQAKKAKFQVTEQIKKNVNNKLIQKTQSDSPFPHIQSVVKTDLKMEDNTNTLPSPYQTPTFSPQITPHTILNTMIKPQVPPKKLHPSIQELRKRKKLIKDDLDL
jgi:dolichyl-phosphate-mannose--protein O-mannosyl transferase